MNGKTSFTPEARPGIVAPRQDSGPGREKMRVAGPPAHRRSVLAESGGYPSTNFRTSKSWPR